jgi:hypothetical protein
MRMAARRLNDSKWPGKRAHYNGCARVIIGTPTTEGESGHPNRFSITRKKGMGRGICPLLFIRL